MLESKRSALSDCLSREELVAYSVGQLPEFQAREVEDHLATCAKCGAALDTMEHPADQLTCLLRDIQPQPVHVGLRGLVDKFKEIDCTDETQWTAPAKVGSYKLLRPLGQGGTGLCSKPATCNWTSG